MNAISSTTQAAVKHATNTQNLVKIRAMTELAKADPMLATTASELDTQPHLLGLSNGVLDLNTGILRDASPSDLMTKQANATFDPSATCPQWEAFMQTTFGNDIALIDYMQRLLGSTLYGEMREHFFFFLYGTGANGKSTLINVIQTLLGDYATTLPTEALMKGKRDAGAATPELMVLRGARMAITQETDDGQHLAESRMKQLTGGDKIVARALYGGMIEFKQTAKLFMVGNHKPQISGTDEGMWRRVHLIPFKITIPEAQRNPDLPKKLIDESSGILNWLLKGCQDWQTMGLKPPPAVVGATQQYRQESDILQQFLEDCCNATPNVTVTKSDLYLAYKRWAERNGHRPWSNNRLGRRMKDQNFQEILNGKARLWDGIELNHVGQGFLLP